MVLSVGKVLFVFAWWAMKRKLIISYVVIVGLIGIFGPGAVIIIEHLQISFGLAGMIGYLSGMLAGFIMLPGIIWLCLN